MAKAKVGKRKAKKLLTSNNLKRQNYIDEDKCSESQVVCHSADIVQKVDNFSVLSTLCFHKKKKKHRT